MNEYLKTFIYDTIEELIELDLEKGLKRRNYFEEKFLDALDETQAVRQNEDAEDVCKLCGRDKNQLPNDLDCNFCFA